MSDTPKQAHEELMKYIAPNETEVSIRKSLNGIPYACVKASGTITVVAAGQVQLTALGNFLLQAARL